MLIRKENSLQRIKVQFFYGPYQQYDDGRGWVNTVKRMITRGGSNFLVSRRLIPSHSSKINQSNRTKQKIIIIKKANGETEKKLTEKDAVTNLNVELDEIDLRFPCLVKRKDRILLNRLQSRIRRIEHVHSATPMPNHHKFLLFKLRSNAVRTCKTKNLLKKNLNGR